jgi:phenylalanyl-tRNA synthetase beta chain
VKISLNWLKEYVKIPEDMDMSRLAYDLTMSTVEVEGTRELARDFDQMVIGVVAEVKPHPQADKLQICLTDIGGGEMQDIVCGGSNLSVGMKVAVALPGAKVKWHGEGELVAIEKTKVRGVQSFGMICASAEIGLFDLFPSTDDSIILDLSASDAGAGTPLAAVLDLDDIILEIDNKSITNRPDLWGHYGIAREISALYNLPLAPFDAFVPPVLPTPTDFTCAVADPVRCPRYIGVRIEGLAVKPSPLAMQSRIWRVGMRPVNALVDITNFVMLATGQPTHAFDSDNIAGHITVRRASDGEKLLLLSGKELRLKSDDLVIADDKSAVGLAGVMGGAKDSVLPTTKKVILEIANFEAISIRRTATRYETRTEAATRYEKAIDPERCEPALALALSLFTELYPESRVTGFSDIYPTPLRQSEIDVSLTWLTKRLGKNIPQEDMQGKLERLGFGVSFNGDNLHVVAPTWRTTGDISIKDDIMEEVARMHGYENFAPTPITTSFTGAINQIEIDLVRKIKEYLAFRCGMHEIFTYPWMSEEYVRAVLPSTVGVFSLSTPPTPEEKYLRSSLLPNLCQAVTGNLRYFTEFSLFETAQVLRDSHYTTPYDARESLPEQRSYVAGAFVGTPESVTKLFRQAKGVWENMPRYTHMEPLTFAQREQPAWADEVVWLNIFHAGEQVGNLALLAKKTALACGIKNSAVVLFETDLEKLTPYPSRTNEFKHLPEFPRTDYDISVLLNSSVRWEEVFAAIWDRKGEAELLQGVSFVDEYRGKQIPAGQKSVTIRLVIGSPDKTLTSSEIENSASTVIRRLAKQVGAKLRS